MKQPHTPTPWKQYKTESCNPFHSGIFVIESDTRKGLAILELWKLNRDPKWRKAHPDAVKEHRETLKEVRANAAFIVKAVNSYDANQAEIKRLRQALRRKN